MEFRYLGHTGLKVSELCLDAMTFGRECDAALSHAIMDRFVAAGGNFIDTADVYSRGVSEEVVGGWLAGRRRDDIVLATKVRFPMGDGPNDVGKSHLAQALAHEACRQGFDVLFTNTHKLLQHLNGGRADGSFERRRAG